MTMGRREVKRIVVGETRVDGLRVGDLIHDGKAEYIVVGIVPSTVRNAIDHVLYTWTGSDQSDTFYSTVRVSGGIDAIKPWRPFDPRNGSTFTYETDTVQR